MRVVLAEDSVLLREGLVRLLTEAEEWRADGRPRRAGGGRYMHGGGFRGWGVRGLRGTKARPAGAVDPAGVDEGAKPGHGELEMTDRVDAVVGQ